MELGVRQRVAATLGISAVAGRAPGAPLPPHGVQRGKAFSSGAPGPCAVLGWRSPASPLQERGWGCRGAVPPWVCCCTVARSSPARMAPRASLGSAGLPRTAHFYVCLTRLGAFARPAAA